EDQGLRVSEEQRLIEEEKVDELYRDVDINQGRGLQVSQDIEDSHVTITPVNPDGQKESSSVSSFVTNMLNPISDAGVESIFTTASSPIAPLQTSIPIMTPSTIATITTSSDAPIPPTTILSAVLQNLLTFDSVFHFKERVKSLEVNFSEFMQTNQFAEAVYNILGAEDQPIVQTSQHPEWFSQPRKPLTSDRDWNKTLLAVQGSAQTWISELAKQADSRSSFNELLDTPIDFSNFIMNRLCVDTLTPEFLAGPTYELMRGSCTSLTELEYHLEEVYKATMDQLDWVNSEGQQYLHNLLQPLPLISDNLGRRVILFAHFINNDLEYLQGDLVPRTMWIHEPLNYDKQALWGVSHWGRKRQQFYGFAVNRESTLDVYSKRRIIAVTDLKIVEWHNYKHLDWISVHPDDDKIYKFKEGDFKGYASKTLKICCYFWYKESCLI
nr:hypothetical protein [Tanacetum cinerariifolium]